MKSKGEEKNQEKEKGKVSSATIFGMIAIIFSLLTFGINYYRQSAEDIRSKKEEFRKNLLMLVDLRDDYEGRIINMINDIERNRATGSHSKKMEVLINAEEFLIRKISNEISAEEYRAFAYYLTMQGHSRRALKYYEIALEKSNGNEDEIASYCELARYYSGEYIDSLFDESMARKYYGKAIELLYEPEDSSFLFRKYLILISLLILEDKCNNINNVKNILNEIGEIDNKLPERYLRDVKSYSEYIENMKKKVSGTEIPK